jgi:RNA polymerase sigma factor (sigma-70 family)
MSEELEHWIQAARGGAQDAFAHLVAYYQDLVRNVIFRIVPASDVDDVAQDVFVSFAKRLQDPDQAALESPGHWLKSVARNRAISYWRRRATQKSIATASLVWIPDTREAKMPTTNQELSAAAALEAKGRQLASLHHCIGLLSAAHREILDGFYGRGQSTELLAAQTGKGTGAVRMMLVRIRRALAKCIRKQMELLDDDVE